MIYLRLFYEFFKTGLFAVGGGLATIPFLQRMGQATGWFDMQTLTDMIAVSESTPGPIGVNMASYTGFTTAGVPGAIIATLGLIAPSYLVILLIAGILNRFKDSPYVKAGMRGIRPASVALITAVLFQLFDMNFLRGPLFGSGLAIAELFDLKKLALGVLIFCAIRYKQKWHPAIFLGAGALAGILLKLS